MSRPDVVGRRQAEGGRPAQRARDVGDLSDRDSRGAEHTFPGSSGQLHQSGLELIGEALAVGDSFGVGGVFGASGQSGQVQGQHQPAELGVVAARDGGRLQCRLRAHVRGVGQRVGVVPS